MQSPGAAAAACWYAAAPRVCCVLTVLLPAVLCVCAVLAACAAHLFRHELEMAGIGLALQAMWAANVLDIQKTLHQVRPRSIC